MKSKQTVVLPEQTVRDIQQMAMDRKEPVLGAVQRTLARGAELALAELRGDFPVGSGNNAPTIQGSVENPTIAGYNSLRVVEAAREAAKTLAEIAKTLDAALEIDVAASTKTNESFAEALRDANSKADELLRSAPRIPKKGEGSEGNTRGIKRHRH